MRSWNLAKLRVNWWRCKLSLDLSSRGTQILGFRWMVCWKRGRWARGKFKLWGTWSNIKHTNSRLSIDHPSWSSHSSIIASSQTQRVVYQAPPLVSTNRCFHSAAAATTAVTTCSHNSHSKWVASLVLSSRVAPSLSSRRSRTWKMCFRRWSRLCNNSSSESLLQINLSWKFD